MTIRPKAIILDYTGVVTVPIPFGAESSAEPDTVSADRGAKGGGAPPSSSSMHALRTLMAHELNNADPNGLWNRLERGEAPLAELHDMVESIVPGAGVFFAGEGPVSLMASIAVRLDVIDRMRAWKSAGVALALLTNNVAEWRPLWTANLVKAGGYELFDVVIDSSAVGMRKPEPAVYRHAVTELGLACGLNLALTECLFVDDFAQNVRGAMDVGLPALLATNDDAHWTTIDALFRCA